MICDGELWSIMGMIKRQGWWKDGIEHSLWNYEMLFWAYETFLWEAVLDEHLKFFQRRRLSMDGTPSSNGKM